MRITRYLHVIALCLSCGPREFVHSERHETVVAALELRSLLDQPMAFNEKIVAVHGYFHCEYEDSGLWTSEDAFQRHDRSARISIQHDEQFTLARCLKYSGRHVTVVGELAAPGRTIVRVQAVRVR